MPWDRAILRDALGVAIASGAYAISFGAISTAAGLSLPQTCALSVLMFTGASQFALVGVIGAAGSVGAGAPPPPLLGSRNAINWWTQSSSVAWPARRAIARPAMAHQLACI